MVFSSRHCRLLGRVLSRLLMIGMGMTLAGFAVAHDAGHSHGHGDHSHDSHSHDIQAGHNAAHGPHVHGQGNLQLVVEGGSVFADLTVPGMDVTGFERAPEDEAGQQAVRDAIALLGNADNVLQLPDAAGCVLAEANAASGLERGGNGHGDFTAAFVFQCRHPDKLDTLRVMLFEHLPQLERVTAEVVSDTGQSQQRLGPGRNAVTIPHRM